MSQVHCLFGYRQETLLGPDAIRRTLAIVRKDFPVLKISSIYKRFFSTRSEDLNSELIFVFKTVTQLEPEKVVRKLSLISSWSAKAEIQMLSYEGLVSLVPEMTIPHPSLALDHAVLRCAAEVWGDLYHPILELSLNDAAKPVNSFANIEFFSQGDTFL